MLHECSSCVFSRSNVRKFADPELRLVNLAKEGHGTGFSTKVNKDFHVLIVYSTPMPLRVGYGDLFLGEVLTSADRIHTVREHFCSPLLQFAAADQDKTFTLIECPSTFRIAMSRVLIVDECPCWQVGRAS